MITAIEPRVVESARYTISQTCKFLGIHRHTLRAYTEAGLISCGFRKAGIIKDTDRSVGGTKFYTGKEIKRFWLARY